MQTLFQDLRYGVRVLLKNPGFTWIGVVTLALGQTLLLENAKAGRDRVVVLSYGLRQRRFGGDANIIGKAIPLNGKSYTVIGMMSPRFRFPFTAEIWMPLNFNATPELQQRNDLFSISCFRVINTRNSILLMLTDSDKLKAALSPCQ